jgi:transposase-like protein
MAEQGKKKMGTLWTKKLRPGQKTAAVSRPKGARKTYDTKFTQECRKQILDLVRRCCSYESACAEAGITSETLRNWRRLGEEHPTSAYGKFTQELAEARAYSENRLVGTIVVASKLHWKAAAYLLTHLEPERWGNRVKVESTLTVSSPFESRSESELEYYIAHRRWPDERVLGDDLDS